MRKACLLIITLLAVSCQKEDLSGRIQLFAEALNSSKVVVDGRNSQWVDGELLRINNTTKTIDVSGGVASIDNTTETVTAPFYAIYPASLCPDADLTASGTIDLTLPSTYHYQRDGSSRQILQLPMAAAAADGNELQFKHLTAALAVSVKNQFGDDITVNEIVVESSLSQISGTRTVDFSNITSQTANDVSVTDAERKVNMVFDEPLVVANNESKDVILPVLPVSSSNKFTVTVIATFNGKRYSFSRTQNTGGALARNEIGYVPVNMSAADEHVSILVNSASDFSSLVSYINGLSASGNTVRVTIDGTVNLGGASVTPINVQGNTLVIEGTNNAVLKNMTFSGASNYYGLTYSTNAASSITINNLTLEDITLPGSNGTQCYIGTMCAYARGNISISNSTVKNISIGAASQTLRTTFGGFVGSITVNSSNSTPLVAHFENCQFIQDGTLVNPSITNLDGPIIGGFIGLMLESNSKTIQLTLENCNVTTSSNSNFTLAVSINASSYFGGLIGQCNMPSITSDFSNLRITNTTCKIDFTITKTSKITARIGGFIGYYNGSNYPATTYWNGNEVSGSIRYTNTGTNNVGHVVGTLADGSNWNGRVTYSQLNISTL